MFFLQLHNKLSTTIPLKKFAFVDAIYYCKTKLNIYHDDLPCVSVFDDIPVCFQKTTVKSMQTYKELNTPKTVELQQYLLECVENCMKNNCCLVIRVYATRSG